MMKLSCRPLTLNLYKAFKKQKQVCENSLLYFLKNFWKKKKKLLYSIIWPLTSNFHHTVKTILILPPAKFHFNHNWGKFYNTLFFSFKKGLNGQNWLDTFLGTEKTQPQTCSKNSWRSIWPVWTETCKNGCTHDALMHLYINQSTKQVMFFFEKSTSTKKLNEQSILCFGKFNSCFDNLCYKKFADKISMDLDINTFS